MASSALQVKDEVTATIVAPWLRLEDEKSTWYNRFLLYYLPLGPGRTLTQAYVRYLEAENAEAAEEKKASGHSINAASHWSEMARVNDWRERADAFDRYNATDFLQRVQEAREVLVRNTKKAAQTLVSSLANPRLQVAAAKEILDRAGLPGARIVGHKQLQPYSADEFNAAQAEIRAWENKIRGEKVIDGDVRDPDADGEANSSPDA